MGEIWLWSVPSPGHARGHCMPAVHRFASTAAVTCDLFAYARVEGSPSKTAQGCSQLGACSAAPKKLPLQSAPAGSRPSRTEHTACGRQTSGGSPRPNVGTADHDERYDECCGHYLSETLAWIPVSSGQRSAQVNGDENLAGFPPLHTQQIGTNCVWQR